MRIMIQINDHIFTLWKLQKEKKGKKVHLTKFNKIRIENFLNLGKIVEAQVQVI